LPIEHRPAEPPPQISAPVTVQSSNPQAPAGTEVDEAQAAAEMRPQFVELESCERVLQISVANTSQARLTVQQVVVNRNPFSLGAQRISEAQDHFQELPLYAPGYVKFIENEDVERRGVPEQPEEEDQKEQRDCNDFDSKPLYVREFVRFIE
jgi:hypothetical protein